MTKSYKTIIPMIIFYCIIIGSYNQFISKKNTINENTKGSEAWVGNGWGKDYYQFPIKEDSEEWKELTLQERTALYQIPEATLNDISTKGLIRTILPSVMSSDIYFFEHPQDAMDKIITEFNAVHELVNRPDAAKHLIQLYRQMSPNKEYHQDMLKEFYFVEYLLAQDEILENMSHGEKNQLLVIFKNNSKAKLSNEDLFNSNTQISLIWPTIKILLTTNDDFHAKYSENEEVLQFIETGSIPRNIDESLLTELLNDLNSATPR